MAKRNIQAVSWSRQWPEPGRIPGVTLTFQALWRDSSSITTPCTHGLWVLAPLWFGFHFPSSRGCQNRCETRLSGSRHPGPAAVLTRRLPALRWPRLPPQPRLRHARKESQCEHRAPAVAQMAQPCPGPEKVRGGSRLRVAGGDTARGGLCCASAPRPRSQRPPVPPSSKASPTAQTQHRESREPDPGVPPALVARRNGRAAPEGHEVGSGSRSSPAGHRDAAWTSTEVRSASTSFPAWSRFPPASRARCGAGAAWHGTARLGLGAAPQRQVGGSSRGSRSPGSSQGQRPCVIALLRGWAGPWGPGELLVRGGQGVGHFWAPSGHFWAPSPCATEAKEHWGLG